MEYVFYNTGGTHYKARPPDGLNCNTGAISWVC